LKEPRASKTSEADSFRNIKEKTKPIDTKLYREWGCMFAHAQSCPRCHGVNVHQ
jgi:hypothetical protein